MSIAAYPTQQCEPSCPLIRTKAKHSRSEEKMPLTTYHSTSTEATSPAKQEDDGDLRRASMVSTVPSTVADDSTIRSSAGGETLPKSAISSSSSSAAAAIPEKKKLLEDESRVFTAHITRSARLTPAPTPAPAQALTISTSSRSVSFGSVEIISFPIVLSDNPGGKMGGPSIGLGPKPLSIHPDTLDLDIYEFGRAGKRRKPGTMLAPPSIRYVSRCCISESSINPAF